MFKFRCIQAFNAEGPGELSVAAEDLVISPSNQPADGWLSVKSLRGGAEGYVPFAYLEFMSMQQTVTPRATGNNNAMPTVPEPSLAGAPQTMQQQQYGAPQGLSQPSVDLSPASPGTASSNPFDNMGGQLGSALPASGSGGTAAADAADRRMSYVVGSSVNAGTKDQYNVTNATQFQETLELWRERERRFMKGEAEKLPEVRKREYFFWDANGVRQGPFTEDEMRARLASGQLQGDTPISISVDGASLAATSLAECFPDANLAFQTAPVLAKAATLSSMWVYRDDMGNVQGPFAMEQMRAWFQDGYFNAETMVKLAHEGEDAWVQLGLLFPEGEGAFLSEGDQIGVKQAQAQLNADAAAATAAAAAAAAAVPPTDPYFAAGANPYLDPSFAQAPAAAAPYDPNVYDYSIGQGSNPFDVGAAAGAGAAAAAAVTWGAGADNQFGAPPPPALDPNGGKDLFSSAIGAPPPALGGAAGAPPAALQAAESDDWGITWDDEDEAEGSGAPNSEAIPMAVTEAEDEVDDRKIIGFAELEKRYLSTVDQLYLFLTRSLPKNLGVVQCKIKRSCVGLHVNYNLYELYLEKGNNQLGPQILMAQKHRKYAVDSYYNIAIGSVNKTEAGKVISSLVFNTSGTNFVCHNHVPAHKGEPRDLSCVHYQKGTHQKQPRKFSVAIPALSEGSETEQIKWPHKGSVKKSLMLQALTNLEFKGLQPLVNKKPTWSAKHKAWVLNFHGRVTRSSVKNFQLVRPDEQKNIVLQFGRTGADTFTMDMQWPISPVAAFAVAVSSLHAKLRVD